MASAIKATYQQLLDGSALGGQEDIARGFVSQYHDKFAKLEIHPRSSKEVIPGATDTYFTYTIQGKEQIRSVAKIVNTVGIKEKFKKWVFIFLLHCGKCLPKSLQNYAEKALIALISASVHAQERIEREFQSITATVNGDRLALKVHVSRSAPPIS